VAAIGLPVAVAAAAAPWLGRPMVLGAAVAGGFLAALGWRGARRIGALGTGLALVALSVLAGELSAVSLGGQSGRLLWCDAALALVAGGALLSAGPAVEVPRERWLVLLGLFIAWSAGTLLAARDLLTGLAELKEWVVAWTAGLLALRYARDVPRARLLLGLVAVTGSLIGVAMVVSAFRSPYGPVLAVLLKKVDLSWGRTNYLAGLLALTLPVGLGLLGSAARARERLLWGAVLAAQSAGLLFSASKGAILALAVALIAASIHGGRAWRSAGLAALVVFGLGAALLLLGPLQQVVRYRLQESALGYSAGERMDLYALAWQSFARSPLWGVGLNNFSVVSNRLTGVDTVPHNFQLGFLSELGLPGCLLAIGWLAAMGRDAWRARGAPGRGRALGVALWAAFVGVVAHNQLESTLYGEQFKILLVMVAAAASRLAAPSCRTHGSREPIVQS
jgi:O-antigen ligase